MSAVYIQRLRAIRDDLDIAAKSFLYIRLNWHKQDVSDTFRPRTQPRVQMAERNLERTYFVRLTAEFEGILKEHLRANHPEIAFPANRRTWTVDWFLNRVLQREGLTLSTVLRSQSDEIRDYRNALAHGNTPNSYLTFDYALARYNKFLDLLPDPRA